VLQKKLTGWTAAESYSEYAALVDVDRRATFYVWTVFTPMVLIFLISCTIFVVPYESFSSRIGICLTALLACIATPFAMSFNLPQIAYLTVIDRAFLVTYACIAVGVLVSTLQATLLRNRPERAARVNRLAGLGCTGALLLFRGLR